MSTHARRRLWALFRAGLSFVALAAALVSLGWLAGRIGNAPQVVLAAFGHAADGTAPLIVIDAGHGGHDGGAVANGVTEKGVALELAQALRQRLEKDGFRVLMTRDDDAFLSLEERSRIANESPASAAFVSLHLNTSAAAPEVSGIETYFSSRKDIAGSPGYADASGELLARCIQSRTCALAGANSRGVREKGYAVVLHTRCPAVLVECGFLTHAAEAAKLQQAAYRGQLADGLAQGVEAFLRAQALGVRGPADAAIHDHTLAAEDP